MLTTTKLLHEEAFLTNKDTPLCSYIDKEKYPEQDKSKLGTVVYIMYRTDETVVKREITPIDYYVRKDAMFVLRWDNEFPFIRIGINELGKIYVVRDINIEIRPDIINKIAIYPEQQYKFFMEEVKGTFDGYTIDNLGTVISCYESEPNFATIMEIIDDRYMRFITGDESIFIMSDDYDPSKSKDNYKHESDVYSYIEDLLEEYAIYGSDSE